MKTKTAQIVGLALGLLTTSPFWGIALYIFIERVMRG